MLFSLRKSSVQFSAKGSKTYTGPGFTIQWLQQQLLWYPEISTSQAMCHTANNKWTPLSIASFGLSFSCIFSYSYKYLPFYLFPLSLRSELSELASLHQSYESNVNSTLTRLKLPNECLCKKHNRWTSFLHPVSDGMFCSLDEINRKQALYIRTNSWFEINF